MTVFEAQGKALERTLTKAGIRPGFFWIDNPNTLLTPDAMGLTKKQHLPFEAALGNGVGGSEKQMPQANT